MGSPGAASGGGGAVDFAAQAALNTQSQAAQGGEGAAQAAADEALGDGGTSSGSGNQGAMQEANSLVTGGARDEAGAQGSALSRQANIELFNKFIPFINMINPAAGMIIEGAASLLDSTGMPIESDYSLDANGNPKSGFSSKIGMSNSGNYDPRANQQEHASGRGKSIPSKIEPTLNTIPTQASEIAAKTTTTADSDFNPEEAATNAVEEERKKARQRIGLMQMRSIDPLFVENLPQIFRSRAY